ncbi:MAG: SusC/RagA family TonB-linked outer membrane protein [Bacteroidales bacterium]|nr:SusC/RagA family TonB-linked outer membrane protein [Bacteroidales bacterium]
MRKFTILLALLAFLGVQAVLAQNTITGTVTSAEDGSPIPGVQVVVKGTTLGTTTDLDGNYELTVDEQAETLVFKFVGMVTKEVPIGDKTVINVTMQPEIKDIEGVVVTALGISREKKSLGYSVQDLEGEDLTKAQQDDAISSLQGRVSGVQIRSSGNMGGSSNIMIRGATTITGDNNPLIVVDGVPIDNSNYNTTNTQAGYGGKDYGNMLNDIPPEQIKNVSVLKGAAAALYGSRAANGVILIETKGAERGKDDFSVNVTSSVDFEEKYLQPQLQDKYGGGAIIADGEDGFETVDVDGRTVKVPQMQVDESWGPRYNENIMVAQWDAWGPEGQLINEPRPWTAPDEGVLDFFNTGVSLKNNISVSKTGENYGIRFDYNNNTTQGTMPNSERDKNNFKLRGNAAIGNKIDVNANLNFANIYTKGRPEIGYGDNSVGQKFYQWGQRQLDYGLLEDYQYEDGTQRTWNRKAYDNPTPQYADNPYWTANENTPEDERNRFYGNLGLTYQILDNLSFEGNIYGDTYNFYIREKVAVGSQAQPYFREIVRSRSEYNYEGRFNYNMEFDKLSVQAVAGGNIREYRYDLNEGETSGGLIVPDVYSLTNSNGNPVLDDITREKRVNSLFLNASFSYDGFLNLDLSGRNDWSSTLPSEENSYFYFGASGSFVFSDLIDSDVMDLGKIRAGYSEVGNDTDPYEVLSTYSYHADGTFQGAPRLFISNELPNRQLKPEQTATTEFGLDLIFLQDRLNLSATYFDKVTTDQIIPLEVSKASGYATKIINAGEMASTGIEVTLGGVPVKTNDFNWRITANLTSTEQTVEEIYPGVDALDIVRAPFGGAFLRASEGDEYGQLWGYDFIRDDNGNKVVTEGGSYMSTPNLTQLGSVYPDYNLGISNDFQYKNWDMSFLIDIQQGGVFYSLTHMWGMYSGMLEETAATNAEGNEIRDPVSEGGGIALDGVQGDVTFNDDGTYEVTNTSKNDVKIPGRSYGAFAYHGYGTPSAQSVFDADYVKLRSFNLGYTLSQDQLKSQLFESIRLSVYGRNLFTWGLDQEGFDPEMTVAGTGNIQGIDGGLQPMSRTYGFKVDINL